MKLSELARGLEVLRSNGDLSVDISRLSFDSRNVGNGCLFFAVPGFKADGHDFAAAAVRAGAAALVTGRWLEGMAVPQLQVPQVRRTMAAAAAVFHGNPASRLTTIGVTGTNGKTTTTFLLDSILRAAGLGTALIGGVIYRILDKSREAPRTTPEAIELQRLLAEAVGAGADAVTMEVSSHGVELHRTDCLAFDVAVFTNLSRDHLDLHADMEAYYRVKRGLFLPEERGGCADSRITVGEPLPVINIDDVYGQRLLEDVGRTPVTFGLSEKALVHAGEVIYSGWETRMNLVVPEGTAAVRLALPGEFNLHNTLAAAAAAVALGIRLDAIVSGLDEARGAPGRFERIDVEAPFRVILDYAHNEDGLQRVLETARNITSGRLITVFGCPGERDREKRPGMGEIAGSLSDLAILTTDDCYGEPAGAILDAVEIGLRRSGGDYRTIPDRREAIEYALEHAADADTVLVAGKGHEQFQIMEDGPHPFSDRDVIIAAASTLQG